VCIVGRVENNECIDIKASPISMSQMCSVRQRDTIAIPSRRLTNVFRLMKLDRGERRDQAQGTHIPPFWNDSSKYYIGNTPPDDPIKRIRSSLPDLKRTIRMISFDNPIESRILSFSGGPIPELGIKERMDSFRGEWLVPLCSFLGLVIFSWSSGYGQG
jgi:hypothetical protein